MKRKYIVCIALTFIVMLLCTACGSASSKTGKNNGDEKITLTITLNSSEMGDTKIYEKYMEEHPNIIIEEVPTSNTDTKLLSMIASGNPPDLIRFAGYDELPVFVQRGLLMPLDDMIAESGNINLDEMHGVVDICRYDGETRGQGSLYGLPKDWSPTGIWVNKDVFADAGVPLPSDTKPMTWDEFAEIAQKLVKKDGESIERHGCITSLTMPTLLEMYMNSYESSMWKDGFASTTLESKEGKDALAYFEALHKTGALASNLYPTADTIGVSAILEDKVGMVLQGYWFHGVYTSGGRLDAASDKLMFIPAPVGTKKASYILDMTCLGVFSETEHPKEAYELFEYLMNAEYAVNARAEIGMGLPINKNYMEKLPYKTEFDKQTLDVVLDYQIDTLDLSPGICPYISYTSLNTLFDKYYLPVLYEKSTLDEAVKNVNKETVILVEEGKELVGID